MGREKKSNVQSYLVEVLYLTTKGTRKAKTVMVRAINKEEAEINAALKVGKLKTFGHLANTSILENKQEGISPATLDLAQGPLKVYDAVQFLQASILWIGTGFHPDTPMATYTDETGNYVFPAGKAAKNQIKLDQCHQVLGEGIYEIGLELLRRYGTSQEGILAVGSGSPAPVDWGKERDRMATISQLATEFITKAVAGGKVRIAVVFVRQLDYSLESVKFNGSSVVIEDAKGHQLDITELDYHQVIMIANEVQKAIAEGGPKA